jgi:hypothetical protein
VPTATPSPSAPASALNLARGQPRTASRRTLYATIPRPLARPAKDRSPHPNRLATTRRASHHAPAPTARRRPGAPGARIVSSAVQKRTLLSSLRIRPDRHPCRPAARTASPPDSTAALPSLRPRLGTSHRRNGVALIAGRGSHTQHAQSDGGLSREKSRARGAGGGGGCVIRPRVPRSFRRGTESNISIGASHYAQRH